MMANNSGSSGVAVGPQQPVAVGGGDTFVMSQHEELLHSAIAILQVTQGP